MTAQNPTQSAERQSTNVLVSTVLAVIFLALAIGAIGIVVSNVSAVIGAAESGEDAGTTLLRFLNDYGIILPLILVGLGLYFAQLSLRLYRREARAAAWARQLLLWAGVLMIVLAIQGAASATAAVDGSMGQALQNALPFVIVAIVAFAAWWWLGQNMHVFEGTETLSESSSRSAWNLLIPTLIVLVVVALRPLEKTFVTSLTDDRFADTAEGRWVGLDNYARLLAFRFDAVQCTRTEAGACEVNANGAIVFPRVRDVVDESYLDLRFREAGDFTIGETKIVFSARDQSFFSSVGNTLIFSIFSVVLELVLGLFVAMVINSKFSGRGLMRAAMLVPWAIPTVVSARLWSVMLRPDSSGVINQFLLSTGFIASPQAWLANTSLQLPAIIAIDVWKTTPFMALVLLAGLQVIPSDLYEAADVDGASKVRQFFKLTLPLLRPAIAVALVFRTLDAVRVFDVFNVLFSDARQSMATYNYTTLVNAQEAGYASAVGVVIFLIILIFTVMYVRILGVSAE